MIATGVPLTLPAFFAFGESVWQYTLDALGWGVEALFLASVAVRVYSFLGFVAVIAGVTFAARWLVETLTSLINVPERIPL